MIILINTPSQKSKYLDRGRCVHSPWSMCSFTMVNLVIHRGEFLGVSVVISWYRFHPIPRSFHSALGMLLSSLSIGAHRLSDWCAPIPNFVRTDFYLVRTNLKRCSAPGIFLCAKIMSRSGVLQVFASLSLNNFFIQKKAKHFMQLWLVFYTINANNVVKQITLVYSDLWLHQM